MKSMKKNYLYNLVFTVMNMIFPLITAPYLSQVLGAESIGKVNYATSIVTWFILFASFGIPRYGIREIARNREDKKELSNAFWNLISIQLMFSLVAIIVYIFIILNVSKFNGDINLYLVMVLMIVLNVFSIDWFYQGIEEYGYITKRNVIFKLISIVLIFLVIKEKEHYIFYAGINIFALSFNNILNYLNIKKYVDKKVYKYKIKFYLSELKFYFMTTLVLALYTQLDQVMIGSISTKDLAFYLRGKMILGVGFSVVNSLTAIFIPRVAYLVENNYVGYKEIIEKSINYIYLLALPCMMGIFLLAEEIMLFLGGVEFIEAKYALYIMCFIILTSSLGGWQVNQILLPHKKEKLAFKLQAMTAIVSVSLNIILIPKYSYSGAAIAWFIAEVILVVAEAIVIKKEIKEIKVNYVNKSCRKYLIAVFTMGVSVVVVKSLIQSNLVVLLLSISIGVLVYFGVIILLKEEIIYNMFLAFKSKLVKK